MTKCTACGSDEVEEADGELMCMDCGEVQEDAFRDTKASGFKVRTIAS